MPLKIETVAGESNVWRPAECYPPNTVLVMKDTGRIFLRVVKGLVRLDDVSCMFFVIDDFQNRERRISGSLFREVKATLRVEL